MTFNLHTHTYRCHHARGTDEEYVLRAIENGYKTIGFSDHAPYIFPGDYYSTFRIERSSAQEYADSVRALQEKYKGTIDIRLGFEVEWYPALIQEELAYLKSFGYDYLLLGQHHVDNEYEPWESYSGSPTASLTVLDKYIDQVLAAADSGEFAYIAHPDLIHFTGNRDIYLQKMEAMLQTLKTLDIPIEFNFLGFTDKRHYPADDFWQLAAGVGNRVVIGLDAHRPAVYADTKHLSEMKAKIASFGITPIQNVNEILQK
ncbi:MAG: histidinol-phosphatase [Eubacterium sp.]|nr:histidinol-phosphatase [Eubacterium sp.]